MPQVNQITTTELWKRQLLCIADDHRKKCDGATCNIMLSTLLFVGLAAGLQFTDEERLRFS